MAYHAHRMTDLLSRPAARRYALSVILVGIVTALLVAVQTLNPAWFNLPIVMLAYLLAISLTTQWTGFYPGAAAAIAAFLCFNFFFIEPRHTLLVSSTNDVITLAIFLVVGLVISSVMGQARRSAIEAEQRERDATRFYELSLVLISTRDVNEIVHALAGRLSDILDADIEVSLLADPQKPPALAQSAKFNSAPPPTLVEVVRSARGNFGEIRVWRGKPLLPGESRLLRTFAGETALVMGRLRAAQSEVRAAVLEESDRLKTALLGSISHELRTPLAAISAGAEGLRTGLIAPDSDAGRETLDDVREAAAHLTKLVNNLLDMTRIESGALKPAREWADLEEIARDAAARARAETARHTVFIQIPDDLPLAPVDPVQMGQVFVNLLSNSAKYAPVGTAIRIRAQTLGQDDILAQVQNESPHLPPNDLSRIFDQFYRVTHAEKVMGTGLGLSICKGIVQAHGGDIWAENKTGDGLPAGRGFVFNFTIPRTWNGASPKLPPPE
jgi:two-component system sensor histidine kinase KdpD